MGCCHRRNDIVPQDRGIHRRMLGWRAAARINRCVDWRPQAGKEGWIQNGGVSLNIRVIRGRSLKISQGSINWRGHLRGVNTHGYFRLQDGLQPSISLALSKNYVNVFQSWFQSESQSGFSGGFLTLDRPTRSTTLTRFVIYLYIKILKTKITATIFLLSIST